MEWVDENGNALAGSRLEVRENEIKKIGCKALYGYPDPDITIEGPGDFRRDRLDYDELGGRIQYMSYTGNIEDDGGQIVCSMAQVETILPI